MSNRNYIYLIEKIIWVIFFLYTSYLVYMGFWCAIQDYASGDVNQKFGVFNYMYPYYLSIFSSLFSLFTIYGFFHQKTKYNLITLIIKHAVVFTLNFVSFIFLFVNIKTFLNIKPTILFPYDIIVFSILWPVFLVMSFILNLKNKKEYKEKNKLYITIPKNTIYIIYTLIVMFFIGDLLCIPLTFDTSFEHIIGCLPIYLLMILLVFNLFVYEFLFKCKDDFIYIDNDNNSNKLNKKDYKTLTIYSISTLILSILFLIWIFIYESKHPNYITESCTAMFPLDHMLMRSPAFSIILLSGLNIIPLMFSTIFNLLKYFKYTKNA